MSAPWEEKAACRTLDPMLFSPAQGYREQEQRARSVCGRCPVRQECLTQALAEEKTLRAADRAGIRAGLNGRERYDLQNGSTPQRRTPRPATPRTLLPCGTPGAYDRHHRLDEPIDEACLAARRTRYQSPRRALAKDPQRPECGTRSGHQWHTAHNEVPCAPCAAADLAVTWFIREGHART
ncbi:WhiB family transcriptional regulator [Streptomyces venezuelae]|uniref:WhiB family transcriptional regulator n=1 Tax=Streptomyces venezuelae TaxID=54571 RepID=UPI003456C65F